MSTVEYIVRPGWIPFFMGMIAMVSYWTISYLRRDGTTDEL